MWLSQEMVKGESREPMYKAARDRWVLRPAFFQLPAGLSMRFVLPQQQRDRGRSKCLQDFTRERHRTRERVPEGRGPASKMRSPFEDAHRFRKVRILENAGDSFEDAHPFTRCAPKTAMLERGRETEDWIADFRLNPKSKIENPKSLTRPRRRLQTGLFAVGPHL